MPYLRLEVSPEVRVEAGGVLRAAAKTIVETLEVKAGSLRLRVETLPAGSYYITEAAGAGAPGNGKPMGSWIAAHVGILDGRSDEKKTRLIAELTRVLAQELSVNESDVRVFVVEYPKVHWGIGGKTAAAAGR